MTPPSGAAPVMLVDGDPASALGADRLRLIDERVLAAWLMKHRWFGAKGSEPQRAHVVDAVPLPDVEMPAVLARVEVELTDGRVERYQLPLVLVAGGEQRGEALVRVESGSGAGHAWIVDGGSDQRIARRMLRAFSQDETIDDGHTRWAFEAEQGVDLGSLAQLEPRAAGTEQSNSSFRCGDTAILKLYRKLEAGVHPEVEMTRYLTRVAGFPHTPALLGVGTVEDGHGGGAVSSMLQELVPGARDAWEIALEHARTFIGAPGESDPPNPFAKEVRELGRNTRAMHEALAAATDDPAMVPATADASDVSAWVQSARSLMLDSLELLAGSRAAGALQGMDAVIADAVLRRKSELVAGLDDVTRVVRENAGLRIRHHGDFHLGQVLHDRNGRFWIVDFEGEPARLLAERRTRNSALRDVAGMLRSFAYAAAGAARMVGGVGAKPMVELRLSRWERAAREAFLGGYEEEEGTSGTLLPVEREARERLLALFETEKVFYELVYELNNRPDWTWIPLRGIGRLLGR